MGIDGKFRHQSQQKPPLVSNLPAFGRAFHGRILTCRSWTGGRAFARCDNLLGYNYEHVQTSAESTRLSSHGARDVALLGGESDFPEASREERQRTPLVFPGWPDHRK